MSRASSTAAELTDTACSAMPVSVRTRLATENDLWKQRCSTRPGAPTRRGGAYCSFSWPRICGSPTTIESRLGGDAEEVAHGVAAAVHVEVPAQRVGVARRARRARNVGQRRAATASASLPHATTSTRLQVERITPSSTPGQLDQRRAAPARAARWRRRRARAPRPARCGGSGRRGRCSCSTSERPAVLARDRAVDADERDHDDREADDGERRRPAPAPADGHAPLQQHGVEHPGEQREEQLRLPRPERAPRLVRPDEPVTMPRVNRRAPRRGSGSSGWSSVSSDGRRRSTPRPRFAFSCRSCSR